MKTLLIFLGLGSMAVALFALSPWKGTLTDERTEIKLRNVGHQVLLMSGDSTSRVLPVERINDYTFLISFESTFTFEPDSLVKVISTVLSPGDRKDGRTENYIVNVLECSRRLVVYGFQIAGNTNSTLVPCSGRAQPHDCYSIKISFEEPFFGAGSKQVAGGILAGLLFYISFIAVKEHKQKDFFKWETGAGEKIRIGKYTFCMDRQVLKMGDTETVLSVKETKLLKHFVSHSNQLLGRDTLLKAVWEDEGVFVGRSLDMFVSKLRKKLLQDPNVKIINVHGRGYKLQVDGFVCFSALWRAILFRNQKSSLTCRTLT